MFTSVIFLSAVNVLTNFSAIAHCKPADIAGAQVDAVVRVISTCSKERNTDPAILVDDPYAGMIILDSIAGSRTVDVDAGDLIRVRGILSRIEPTRSLFATSIDIVSKTTVPNPVPASADMILNGDCDNKLISLCGRVHDTTRDDIDPNFYFLVLDCNGKYVYTYFSSAIDRTESCKQLVNAQVRIRGICRYSIGLWRKLAGRTVNIREFAEISVLRKPDNAFDTQDLDCFRTAIDPTELSALGRRRITGRVLAASRRTPMILSAPDGNIINVKLSSTDIIPRHNDIIDAVGNVATDLYRMWLLNAQWRKSETELSPARAAKVHPVTSKTILCDESRRPRVNMSYHGQTISLDGTVISMPADPNETTVVLIHDDYADIPIDVTSAPSILGNISVGCKIRVVGTCSINTELWHPLSNFPRAQGFTVVPRSQSDVTVISKPSWWTPKRLVCVIIALCVLLSAFLAWIRILNKIIYRRSRQLLKEEVARASADLRVDERTRLATELHDSVSQNLAALACHLSAIGKTVTTVPDKAIALLQVAENLLQSCRTDLRHCLYDLRSDLLDLSDFSEAIRQTLYRVSGEATVLVRFHVSRARMHDPTAHTILCIVRELASNAVTHGHATQVKVAGSIDKDRLLFSVKDNGTGFDPSAAKGFSEGHFGLDGIRNRVRKLDGTFTIHSKYGHGARAIVSIPLKRK